MYQEIWERVLRQAKEGNFQPVVVRLKDLTDSQFLTIRKAFYKEKDIDKENGGDWRSDVSREGDLIKFSIYPKRIEERF